MTLRLVGTCPVCERQQKVTPQHAMVHHGFVRPGVGHIIGDCFGVGWPAYEISSEGCVAYRKTLAGWIQGQQEHLQRLEGRPSQMEVYLERKRETRVFRRDADDARERERYEIALRESIKQANWAIRDFERADRRMLDLIARWAPAPLLEIDEEGLTPVKRQERAARKTERDTKRSEKERKRHEQQIKRNERLARKATQLLFFFDEFERLAQTPPSAARTAYAHDLIFEAAKKKYGLDYPQILWRGPDDGYGNRVRGPWGDSTLEHAKQTLVELGVARREAHVHGDYVTVIPVYYSQGNKIRVPDPDPSQAEEILADIAAMTPPERR